MISFPTLADTAALRRVEPRTVWMEEANLPPAAAAAPAPIDDTVAAERMHGLLEQYERGRQTIQPAAPAQRARDGWPPR